MAATTHNVEICVMIDDQGNYIAGADTDTLADKWDEEMGYTPLITRVLKVNLTVEMPEPTELSAHVPANDTNVTMEVKG